MKTESFFRFPGAMLEYLSGLQLRALTHYEPSIPAWWWKQGVCRRTTVRSKKVLRHKFRQEARIWTQARYYAIRGPYVYCHIVWTRDGEPSERENTVLDLPEKALALRDPSGDMRYPIALLDNGDQYILRTSSRREMIPLRLPYRLRDFELH